MGWGSSADYHAPTRMDFSSRADAIHFAEKQGELRSPVEADCQACRTSFKNRIRPNSSPSRCVAMFIAILTLSVCRQVRAGAAADR